MFIFEPFVLHLYFLTLYFLTGSVDGVAGAAISRRADVSSLFRMR